MADANEISHARISSCFMHFEGVTEQLCQVSRQRLKKFIECRHKWAKLDCVQADIAKSSYNKFDDDFVNTYLAENTESSFALKWYHHMRCYKKFCDEEKIRRQERSEEKRAEQITETVPITEDSSMQSQVERLRVVLKYVVQLLPKVRPCLKEISMYCQSVASFVEEMLLGLEQTRYDHF